MTLSLDDFKVFPSETNAAQTVQAPRYWRLLAIYESPIAIAVHLSPDRAAFRVQKARDALLQWLTLVEHTARENDVVRPVIACLQIDDDQQHYLSGIERWENDPTWCKSGHVVYVEHSDKSVEGNPISVEQMVRERLERILFRSVKEIELRDEDLSWDKRIDSGAATNPSARVLVEGVKDFLAEREKKHNLGNLKAQLEELMEAWRRSSDEKPSVDLSKYPTEEPLDVRDTRESVERLAKVTLKRFRGWYCTHPVTLDADIVLLTGPNGYGKSSFVESIVLSLTGHTTRSVSDLFPRQNGSAQGPGVIEVHHGVSGERLTRFDIHEDASPKDGASEGSKKRMPDYLRKLRRSDFWANLHRWTGSHDLATKTEANLTAVFGDRLHERFLEGKDDLIRSLSMWGAVLDSAQKALKGLNERLGGDVVGWDKEIARREDSKKDKETQDNILAALPGFHTAYARFRELYLYFERKPILAFDLVDNPAEQIKDLHTFVDKVGEALGGSPQKAFNKALDVWERQEKEQALSARAPEIDAWRAERHALEEKYPNALERASAFEDTAAGQGMALDDLLRALSRNLQRWHAASRREGLAETTVQLERVSPTDLERLASITCDCVSPLRDAARRMRWLKDKDGPLLAFWKVYEDRVKFEKEKDVSDLREQKKRAQAQQAAIDEAEKVLDPLRVDKQLRDAFEHLLNDVLSRIHLTSGMLPAKVDAEGTIRMADRRTIDDLSTGQKTQLAVALSVGANLALSPHLGSRVLAMDDVSAAYDVSNIAREAALWRSVAYGHLARTNGGEDRHRRQLILSSHNEDATRRLIDMLRPPEGATMKVVRFLDWKEGGGPELEIHDVHPAAPSSGRTRGDLLRAAGRIRGKT